MALGQFVHFIQLGQQVREFEHGGGELVGNKEAGCKELSLLVMLHSGRWLTVNELSLLVPTVGRNMIKIGHSACWEGFCFPDLDHHIRADQYQEVDHLLEQTGEEVPLGGVQARGQLGGQNLLGVTGHAGDDHHQPHHGHGHQRYSWFTQTFSHPAKSAAVTVLRSIKSCLMEVGISRQELQAIHRVDLEVTMVDEMLEYLAMEGHIYTTSDQMPDNS